MSEPRFLWVAKGSGVWCDSVSTSPPENPNSEYGKRFVKVIEASAYDKLEAEMYTCSAHYKAARKLISKIQNDRRVAYRKIIDLKSDRDNLRKALEKIKNADTVDAVWALRLLAREALEKSKECEG